MSRTLSAPVRYCSNELRPMTAKPRNTNGNFALPLRPPGDFPAARWHEPQDNQHGASIITRIILRMVAVPAITAAVGQDPSHCPPRHGPLVAPVELRPAAGRRASPRGIRGGEHRGARCTVETRWRSCTLAFTTGSAPSTAAAPQMAPPVEVEVISAVSRSIFSRRPSRTPRIVIATRSTATAGMTAATERQATTVEDTPWRSTCLVHRT